MELFMAVVLMVVVVSIVYLFVKTTIRPKNFPPGPPNIPLIGSIFYLTTKPHLGMMSLAKKYGNIFSVKYLGKDMVCVVGYELLNEILVKRPRDFSNRYNSFVQKRSKGDPVNGIVDSHATPRWAANRKLVHQTLKAAGVGKNPYDQVIQNEVSHLIQAMENSNEKPYDPSNDFLLASYNLIASFIMGERYDYTSIEFLKFVKSAHEMIEDPKILMHPLLGLPDLIPGSQRIYTPAIIKWVYNLFDGMFAFIETNVKHHLKTHDPNSPRDFIDHYITEKNRDLEQAHFTDKGLHVTTLDMFQAGSETINYMLQWILIYLANHQDVQDKVYKEIEQVIGLGRQPRYSDHLNMPYTSATILEIQRLVNIIPTGLVHSPVSDVELAGYKIPYGTTVFPCLYSSHMDPNLWKNPHEFNPLRFIGADGNVLHRKGFFPFGGGIRICVGLTVAKHVMFVGMTTLVQRFKFRPPSGNRGHIDTEPKVGILSFPKKFKIVAANRDYK